MLSASIENVELPDAIIADSRGFQELLLRGGTIAAAVIPANPTRGIAPIVRVADAEQRQMLLLAQDGDILILGVHTGAEVLRLRPPLFALAGVFPAGTSNLSTVNSSLSVGGRYRAGEVRMHAQDASRSSDSRIVPTASLGWTLLLPFQWFIKGTVVERIVSWLWIGLLVLPLGYWSPQAQDSSRFGGYDLRWTVGPLLGLAIVVAGVFIGKILIFLRSARRLGCNSRMHLSVLRLAPQPLGQQCARRTRGRLGISKYQSCCLATTVRLVEQAHLYEYARRH